MNEKVNAIHCQNKEFCQENGHNFVRHNSLQIDTSDLYDDDVYISRGGGTALFVNDIHKTIISRSRPSQEHFQRSSGGRVYFGRSDGSRQAYGNRGGPRQAVDLESVTGEPEQTFYHGQYPTRNIRSNNDVDIGQMVQLLTLNQLNFLQTTTW